MEQGKKQIFWGAVIGVITVGLMGVSYSIGLNRGKGEVKGEQDESLPAEITEREVYIAVKSDCEEYEVGIFQEGSKETRKYCIVFVEDENAFAVLNKLDQENEDFSFFYDEFDFGVFVTSVNNYHPDVSDKFWAFYVNGEMSMVGVSDYIVNDGDELLLKVDKVEL